RRPGPTPFPFVVSVVSVVVVPQSLSHHPARDAAARPGTVRTDPRQPRTLPMTLVEAIERFEAKLSSVALMIGMPDISQHARDLERAHNDLLDALLSHPENDPTDAEYFLPAAEVTDGVYHRGIVYAAGYGPRG